MYTAVMLLLPVIQLSSLPSAAFVNLFEQRSIECKLGSKHCNIPYRLFLPRQIDEQEFFPLVVWLHGSGSRGDDNIRQLQWIDEFILTTPDRQDDYNFFLLAIQVPESERNWCRQQLRPNETPDLLEPDMLHVVIKVIDDLIQLYRIDSNRIVATGVSMGSFGCWELGVRYPERFAGIAPISMAGGNIESMPRLKSVPLWAFNCSNDAASPLIHVEERIEAIKSSGGCSYLTIINSDQHDAWTAAFTKHHLLKWLLLQDRQSRSSGHWGYLDAVQLFVAGILENWSVSQIIFQSAMFVGIFILGMLIYLRCNATLSKTRIRSIAVRGGGAAYQVSNEMSNGVHIVRILWVALSVSCILLIFQLFPPLMLFIVWILDIRNWTWIAVWSLNILAIATLIGYHAWTNR